MIIDFNSIPETVLPHFKNGEKCAHAKMHVDPLCRIMRVRLEPGASIGLHTHETSCEIVYFFSGSGKAIYDGAEERISAGACHYCPKGHSHTVINDGTEDLLFLGIVPEQ